MNQSPVGDGFATFDLPDPLGRVTMGICMDLNVKPPASWTLDGGPYELADHCIAKQSHILVLLNAWLDSGDDGDREEDWHTLNYWASRLRPLWRTNDSTKDSMSSEDIMVIINNRCGEENGSFHRSW
jgi:protein N-terminal amidase